MYQKPLSIMLIKLILIFNLINELVANGPNKVNKELLNLSDIQLSRLAELVCYELDSILDKKMQINECIEHYQSRKVKNALSSQPFDVQIKCQTKTSRTFKTKPSRHRRLVMLVEEAKRSYDYIPLTLIEPNEQFGRLEDVSPRRRYTVWAATLDANGRPLKWMKGPPLLSYNATSPQEQRDYNISVNSLEFIKKGKEFYVKTVFKWDTSDNDMCYEVAYICGDSIRIKTKKIWPTKTPELTLELPTDNTCSLQVIGPFGNTNFDYKTPSCADNEDCTRNNKKPWTPELIDVHAKKYGFDSWTVRVNWTQPRLLPEKYNVTLRTDKIQSVIVDGNATEAVFDEVYGEGIYNVSVSAIIQNRSEHTSRQAIFPGGGVGVWWWGMGGLWALALTAATSAAVCLACRRQKPSDKDLLYPEMKEKIKEFDIEAFGSESGGSDDQWEVRVERLAVHEVVGEGAFGVVRRGTLTPPHKEVAVKMLKDFPSLEEIRSFRAEMELMKSVGSHPHIVSLVGCCSGRRPLIVTEYCSKGDLLSYLRCAWDVMVSKRHAKYYNNNLEKSDYRDDLKYKLQRDHSTLVVNKLYDLQGVCDIELTALNLLSFCRQIAMGMEYLSSNKVVHRDLAARNILITGDRTLKIADFGLSRDVYEENQYKQKGNGKLPVKWMALESLTRKVYTTQSDVWSFGVVIWEVVTVGGSPYPDVPAARLLRLLRAGYRMPKPVNCSKQLYELMYSCWRAHPRERPTFAELHQKLDELLNGACADEYLSLELEPDDAPTTPKSHRYLKIFNRGKRHLTRGESYERPLKPPQNHYSSPPVTLKTAA